jgi:hypothetical protein
MRHFAEKAQATLLSVPARPGTIARTRAAHDSLVGSIHHLQRTVGNQAVLRLLQAQRGEARRSASGRVPRDHGLSSAGLASLFGTDARGGGGAEFEDQRPAGDTLVERAPPGPGAPTPTPVAVRNGPAHAPIDEPARAGMSIAITVTSSSGVDADMARIQDSEQVAMSSNHTGCWAGVPPMASNNSGFMAGYPIPDDQHAWGKAQIIDRADNHGGNGSFEKQQLDIYTDAAAGVTAPTAIPASGYIIKRITTVNGTGITLRTEKRPAAVTVKGFSTTAGPSPTQAEDVVVRAPSAGAGGSGLSTGAKAGIGIGGGALVGAGIGALVGGPVGAGVGAVAGGIIGGLGSLLF